MDRRARYRQARPRRRDSLRQTLTVIAVGASLGGSLFVIGEHVTAPQRDSAQAEAVAAAQNAEVYAGSILYMPNEGRNCHQLLFDNQSGRFTDKGQVDCVDAAYRSPREPKFWSAARAHVISDGFRDR
jgi:hypothetical protein